MPALWSGVRRQATRTNDERSRWWKIGVERPSSGTHAASLEPETLLSVCAPTWNLLVARKPNPRWPCAILVGAQPIACLPVAAPESIEQCLMYSLTGIHHASSLPHVKSKTFSALGEPSRLRIVELLRGGPLPVGEIAAALAIRQPQVSKHLRVLAEAGLVTGEPLARRRIYHLEAEPFEEISAWIDSFERLWDARPVSLGGYMDSIDTERREDAGDG